MVSEKVFHYENKCVQTYNILMINHLKVQSYKKYRSPKKNLSAIYELAK